jgi:hypothetical protein
MNRKGSSSTAVLFFILLAAIVILWGLSQIKAAPPTQSSPVSQGQAITIVTELPEVQAWVKSFNSPNKNGPLTQGSPAFAISSTTPSSYIVWVYEDMHGYTTTFGYYDVDKNTGSTMREQ